MQQLGNHTHTFLHSHSDNLNEKLFTFAIKADSSVEAVAALKFALETLSNNEVVIRESGTAIGCSVMASYSYPNRPHCAMIGPYWDE